METTASDLGRTARADTTPQPWPWPRFVAWIALGVLSAAVLLMLGSLQETGTLRLTDVSTESPVTTIGVATLCYLAAGATGIRWLAWAAVPVASVLPFAAAALDLPRWTVFVAAGVVVTALGLVYRRRTTWPQAVAMAGYFGVAVLALALAPRVGLALAAVALIAHAAWDWVHYRRDVVVNRSLAVWCMGLDVFLGGLGLIVAIGG